MTMEDYRRLVETLSEMNDLRVENSSKIPPRIAELNSKRKRLSKKNMNIGGRRDSAVKKFERNQKLGPEITKTEEELSRLEVKISSAKESMNNIEEEISSLPKFVDWREPTFSKQYNSNLNLLRILGIFLLVLAGSFFIDSMQMPEESDSGCFLFYVSIGMAWFAWKIITDPGPEVTFSTALQNSNVPKPGREGKTARKIQQRWDSSEDGQLKEKHDQLNVKLTVAKSHLAALEGEARLAFSSLSSLKMSNSEKSLKSLKDEISGYERSISEIEEQGENLNSEIEKEKTLISSNKKEIERLHESISGLVPYVSALTVRDSDS